MKKPPPAIIAIGRNYADHAAEMGNDPLERPIVFMKNPACVIGPEDYIVIPPICDEPAGRETGQVDFEGELAVIIGHPAGSDRPCRDVPESEALKYVNGYAVANDVTARWWQKIGSGGQYVRGKSFDTFCPITDPVPASQVTDPQNLELITRLNGEIMQRAHTSTMIFSVQTLIAELSRGMTLLDGTVLLTGTPSGVGSARKPPRFLQDGDVVEVEIAGVGRLCNPVILERGD